MYKLCGVRLGLTVALLFAALCRVVAVPEAVVEIPAAVRQGEMFSVTITSATVDGVPLDGVAVDLALPDGARRSAPVWRAASHAHSGRTVWIALLGVPSTARTGDANVLIRSPGDETDDRRESLRRMFSLRVEAGRFRDERIALNSDMSALRTTDDPRRVEQSRTLWELIHRADIGARVHPGRFRTPLVEFRETSFFGDRREFSYADGGSARSIHNGWDLAAPTGTPVFAPASGRVVMAEDRIITGLSVVLEHMPGVFSLYYHLDSMDVDYGEVVSAGSTLGTVGSTGLSTGPHLHWEVRVAGAAVDPRVYLSEPLVDTATLVRSLSVVP